MSQSSAPPPRPAATRLQPPSWRNTRVLLGALLILLSTALGWRVVAAADQRTPMYAAATALKPGDRLRAESLRRVDVLPGDGVAAYLVATKDLPADAYLVRDVREGELVPMSALGTATDVAVQPVTVRVDTGAAGQLVAGSVVDVWVSRRDPAAATERYQPAAVMLKGVTVASVPRDQGSFGVSATTLAIPLLVPKGEVQQVITAIDEQSRFTLVPVPGSLRAGS